MINTVAGLPIRQSRLAHCGKRCVRMDTNKVLKFLEQEIHSVVMATVDDNGLPITCAIDIMDSNENGLYFLTAKVKGLYDRLKKNRYIALTGMKGKDTLSCVAVSIGGKVREIGNAPLQKFFSKNQYMNEIYPTEQSRQSLTVFYLYEGNGEWFDLSKKTIERVSFMLGNSQGRKKGYEITKKCIGCKACKTVCPQDCIDFTAAPAVIKQEHCLHCGNCLKVCLQKAVVRRG